MRKRVEDMTDRELELCRERLERELSEDPGDWRLEACLDDVMTEMMMRRIAM